MNKVIKWVLILGCVLIMVLFGALLMAPKIIDVQKYRPQIQKVVSNATGCSFTLGENLQLSLFPWISLSADELRLGSPPGFEEKYLVTADFLKARVKFIPLVLSRFKNIQVKPFILEGAQIIFETNKDGSSNWEGIKKAFLGASSESQAGIEKRPDNEFEKDFGIDAVSGSIAIKNSSFIWINHAEDERFKISDLNLELRDVKLEHPIFFVISARVEGHSLSIDGNVGPLGNFMRKGIIPLDLTANVLEQLDVKLKGNVKDAVTDFHFNLSIDVPQFSPKKLMAAAGKKMLISTADPKALTRAAFKANFKGDSKYIEVSNGIVNMDESTLHFSCKVRDFFGPDVTFDLELDQIDLDQYLSPETGNKLSKRDVDKHAKKFPSGREKTDYAPLRRLILEGDMRIGELKLANARMQDINLKVNGTKGVFNLEPLHLNLYQGKLTTHGSLNVSQDVPECSLSVQAKEIHTNPLFKDIFKKDILEGKLDADLMLKIKGDDADRIKKNMNGKGNILIENGAVKGIDLVSMVRNMDGAYGFATQSEKKPRTEFTEFQVPFTIDNGVLNTGNSRISSMLIRVLATGKVDLVKETLNLRMKPIFVTTKKKDKEKMKRSEVMVPVLVTGSLSSPEFRPDLKGIVKQKLEEKVFKSSKFKKFFEKEEMKPFEEDAKKLLEGILNIPHSENDQ